MRALDEAVFAALDAEAALTGKVFYGSPLRDTAPGFVSYFPVASKPAAQAGFRTDGREYTYELVAADRSGLRAEALIEAAEGALVDRRLPVDGWGTTATIAWAGDLHDLGDLEADGTVVHLAGRLVTIVVQRPRQ